MPVRSLYTVLARAVSLQLPMSCASPFLCMSSVPDSFPGVGVLPVIHKSTGLYIAMWAVSGNCLLGMLSGPALFLFGSVLTCC